MFMGSFAGSFVKGPSFAAAAAIPRVDVEKDAHAAAPAAACIVSSEIEVLFNYVHSRSGKGRGYHSFEAIKFQPLWRPKGSDPVPGFCLSTVVVWVSGNALLDEVAVGMGLAEWVEAGSVYAMVKCCTHDLRVRVQHTGPE